MIKRQCLWGVPSRKERNGQPVTPARAPTGKPHGCGYKKWSTAEWYGCLALIIFFLISQNILGLFIRQKAYFLLHYFFFLASSRWYGHSWVDSFHLCDAEWSLGNIKVYSQFISFRNTWDGPGCWNPSKWKRGILIILHTVKSLI